MARWRHEVGEQRDAITDEMSSTGAFSDEMPSTGAFSDEAPSTGAFSDASPDATWDAITDEGLNEGRPHE